MKCHASNGLRLGDMVVTSFKKCQIQQNPNGMVYRYLYSFSCSFFSDTLLRTYIILNDTSIYGRHWPTRLISFKQVERRHFPMTWNAKGKERLTIPRIAESARACSTCCWAGLRARMLDFLQRSTLVNQCLPIGYHRIDHKVGSQYRQCSQW